MGSKLLSVVVQREVNISTITFNKKGVPMTIVQQATTAHRSMALNRTMYGTTSWKGASKSHKLINLNVLVAEDKIAIQLGTNLVPGSSFVHNRYTLGT